MLAFYLGRVLVGTYQFRFDGGRRNAENRYKENTSRIIIVLIK